MKFTNELPKKALNNLLNQSITMITVNHRNPLKLTESIFPTFITLFSIPNEMTSF